MINDSGTEKNFFCCRFNASEGKLKLFISRQIGSPTNLSRRIVAYPLRATKVGNQAE